MLKRLFMLFLILLSGASVPAQAVSLSDVVLPQRLDIDGTSLTLNGWGVRKKLFVKLYVGALYLPSRSADAATILDADAPIGVRLHILSKLVSAKKMEKAIKEGFERSTGGKTASIRREIEQFLSFFHDNVSEDDIFDIVYLPGKGVQVVLNGRELGSIDAGPAFRKALFGIWLGPDPVQEDLKAAMLGK